MAPASTHISASDLMESNICGIVETCARKILPFLSFQIHQQTNANSVSNPFCKLPGSNILNSCHLSLMEHTTRGSDRSTPRVAKIANQTCKVTVQEANRWSLVSGSWSQRGQFVCVSSPCLALLSAVQWRCLNANQRKIFTFSGAQVCQISLCPGKVADPWCSIRYADFAEYWPLLVHRQMHWSSWWGCRCTLSSLNQSCKYSAIAITDKPPWIPLTHCRFCIASATVNFDLTLLLTAANSVGARSDMACPSSQLSTQKSVVRPLPTVMVVEALKNAKTTGSTWIGNWAQARSLSVFWSQSHLVCKGHGWYLF